MDDGSLSATLLRAPSDENGIAPQEGDLDISLPGSWRSAYKAEAKRQIIFSMPMVGMNALQYLLNLVAVIFVGHLGKLELAAASLATTMVNISGHILLQALASALETFCGQAYGAKQYSLVGEYCQRAIIVLSLVSIPVAFFWWFMEPALILIGQDPTISHMAGCYARYLIPSLFASALTQPMVKFFQAQSETLPLAVFQLFTLVIHVPLIYWLIWPAGFGYLGAAVSASVAWWVNILLLMAFLKFSGQPKFAETWTGFSPSALDLRSMWQFLQLAIPSAVMLCLEYWCFEMVIIFAGMLPDPELQVSVISIGFNTVNLSWTLPYGISAAVSTRVSNELGAGHPSAARFATHVSYSMVFAFMAVIFSLLVTFSREWAAVFVRDKEVIDSVSKVMPFVAWICFNDGVTGINAGSVRGIGHQHLGAMANLCAYYGIGLPTSYFLTFVVGYGVMGLWWGMLSGQLTQVLLLASLVLLFTDWKEEARKASERVLEESEDSDEEATVVLNSQETPIRERATAPVEIRRLSLSSHPLPLNLRGSTRISTGLYVGSLT